MDKLILKCVCPRIAKTILKSKSEMGGINLPDFKTLYNYSNQDSMVLAEGQTHKSVGQKRKSRNRHKYAQLIFDQNISTI